MTTGTGPFFGRAPRLTLLCPGAVELGDGAGEPLGSAIVECVLTGECVRLDLLQPLSERDAFTFVLGAADLRVQVEQTAWREGAEESANFRDRALVMAFRPGGVDLGTSEVEHGHVAEGTHRPVEVLGEELGVGAVGRCEATELGELRQHGTDVVGVAAHVLLGRVQHHAEDQLWVAVGSVRVGVGRDGERGTVAEFPVAAPL